VQLDKDAHDETRNQSNITLYPQCLSRQTKESRDFLIDSEDHDFLLRLPSKNENERSKTHRSFELQIDVPLFEHESKYPACEGSNVTNKKPNHSIKE
jgi:hypothetical protein